MAPLLHLVPVQQWQRVSFDLDGVSVLYAPKTKNAAKAPGHLSNNISN